MKETNLNGESKNIVLENIEKLKVIFPEAVCEDTVNFEVLKQLLEREREGERESLFKQFCRFISIHMAK